MDVDNIHHWDTRGVAAPWRNYGIKLAHLVDAAKGISGISEANMQARFFLAFSPLNIFPLPDIRRVNYSARFEDETASYEIENDVAEDKGVKETATGCLIEYLDHLEIWDSFSKLAGIPSLTNVDYNWEYEAECVKLAIVPKQAAKAA